MSHRILVVEDNAANLELLQEWLDAQGYEVQSATNLNEAFQAFAGVPPDAVLLDIKLGSQDGLDLALWIRRDPALRAIPVIAVTAHAMITDFERVVRAGCNACVSKPVNFRELKAELERWLAVPAKSPPGG
jgi:two-component system, cell cycle response regulator DivK